MCQAEFEVEGGYIFLMLETRDHEYARNLRKGSSGILGISGFFGRRCPKGGRFAFGDRRSVNTAWPGQRRLILPLQCKLYRLYTYSSLIARIDHSIYL